MRSAALVRRKPIDFHTSNIQRAQKSDLHGLSCAWETRFYGRPKGVLTTETKRQNARQNDKLFRRVSAISRPNGLFFHIFSAKTEKIWPAERRMRLRKPHRASGAFETRRRRHSAPFRRTRNNPIAGAQNGASASVQDTNPVQMIPEQKQGNAYERTA